MNNVKIMHCLITVFEWHDAVSEMLFETLLGHVPRAGRLKDARESLSGFLQQWYLRENDRRGRRLKAESGAQG